MKTSNGVRLTMRQAILDMGKVQRLHIIGAARSGTTMIHYAMAAFENTILRDKETNTIWDPSLRASIKMLARSLITGQTYTFVTKRNIGWYLDKNLSTFEKDAIAGKIGVLNMIRDPRDTLTSMHQGSSRAGYYLEPSRWVASVAAGSTLLERLPAHCPRLTVRYEDLVTGPAGVREAIEKEFGLRLREGITDWAKLKENVERLELPVKLDKALHKLRDFDPSSIGKWRTNKNHLAYLEEVYAGEYGDKIKAFLDYWGYESND